MLWEIISFYRAILQPNLAFSKQRATAEVVLQTLGTLTVKKMVLILKAQSKPNLKWMSRYKLNSLNLVSFI